MLLAEADSMGEDVGIGEDVGMLPGVDPTGNGACVWLGGLGFLLGNPNNSLNPSNPPNADTKESSLSNFKMLRCILLSNGIR